ncbi:citrate lyase holo-[acyl-carrier protein] synthase [Blautia sp. An81]|uniref:citrate lyase holo-[acyl-carrier protein] synthase n=1 Tax=Blautia sp. An81 TaxID=1965659 RepID=UPI000B374938|nr:citrate lyase holo-[acyl-carrier protein] synthase [Blautia sp. An81]OUN30858.1 citrate lyase holo-[acyl-carrier protein] synthase [Blautia sp. An81]
MRLELWTEGKEASLGEILDARERRGKIQRELMKEKPASLVSFTLNIPGPVKTFPFVVWLFDVGNKLIQQAVKEEEGEIIYSLENRENTGCESFYSLTLSPEKIKRSLATAEDKHPLGRLFDFDVLDSTGRKVSRQELGFSERKCLLCGEPAFYCSRSRRHSAQEVFHREIQMMENFYIERMASHIGLLMQKSLLYEVNATLKPGLVDRAHNGAHQDMSLITFADSAYALTPYFIQCAREGLNFSGEKEELPGLFEKLRVLGIEGEKNMREATGGVNTHKGMVFSGGIFCCCAGYGAGSLMADFRDNDFLKIFGEVCRSLTSNLMADYKGLEERGPRTHGEKLYAEYQVEGIRGEAWRGFPHVLERGVFYFEKLLEEGYSLNDAGLLTLLQYISSVEDTNMIIRSDYHTVLKIQKELEQFLKTSGPEEQLEIIPALDTYFVKRNISPGGSADMLALTYFLHFLKNIQCPFETFDIERGECVETFR